MKGHSDKVTLACLLNYETDYYASKSQKIVNSVHPSLLSYLLLEWVQFLSTNQWVDQIPHSHFHKLLPNQSHIWQTHHQPWVLNGYVALW